MKTDGSRHSVVYGIRCQCAPKNRTTAAWGIIQMALKDEKACEPGYVMVFMGTLLNADQYVEQ